MRTDELKDVLSRHGDEVHDIGVHARTDAVRRRVRGVRRRRATLASGAAAAAVAAVALAVVPGVSGSSSPGPAEQVDRSPASRTDREIPEETWSSVYGYTKDGMNFPMEVAGQALMAAEIGHPGEAEIEVDLVIPDGGLRWVPICYGVGGDRLVRVAVDGHLLGGFPCRTTAPVDPASGGTTFGGDPTARLRDWGLQPGDMTSARVWLSRAGSPARVVVRDPGATIGVVAYEEPGGEGLADLLPETFDHAGRSWTLSGVSESSAGDPMLEERVGRPGQPVLVVAGVDRLRGGSAYTVSVGGEQVARAGNTGVAGPTWEPVAVVDAGTRTDVRMELEGARGEVRFVLAEYRPAR